MASTPVNQAIAAGGKRTYLLPLPLDEIPAERLAEIDAGNGVLMLSTRFMYTDALGTGGDSSDCWSYDPGITSNPDEPGVPSRRPRFIEWAMSAEFGFGVR
jgi:hypothetical protein